VLTHASIVFGGMLASVNSVKNKLHPSHESVLQQFILTNKNTTYGIDSVPVVVLAKEVQAHNMATDGREFEPHSFSSRRKPGNEFVNGTCTVETLSGRDLSTSC